MTKQEALSELGISYSTLRRYVDQKLIRTSTYHVPGKRNKMNVEENGMKNKMKVEENGMKKLKINN